MRKPAVAGQFYPAEQKALRMVLQDCFLGPLGPGKISSPGNERNLLAALSPHAGLMASGMGAAHVYDAILRSGLPEAYVIIGPKHRHRGAEVSLCDETFITPLGNCPVHGEIISDLKESFLIDNAAHRLEHSLEMQVLFIQYIDPNPFIVPILMGDQSETSASQLAEIIRQVISERNVMVIASGDMSHYVSKSQATKDDGALIEKMLKLDVPGLYDTLYSRNISACGYGPTATAMMATSPKKAKLLKYMDSGDVFESSEVVGYASVGFYQ